MDGSSMAGNPSAASSGSLPARSGQAALRPAPEPEAARQNRESVGPPGSQNHQSPAQTPDRQLPATDKLGPEALTSSKDEPNPVQPEPQNTGPGKPDRTELDPATAQQEQDFPLAENRQEVQRPNLDSTKAGGRPEQEPEPEPRHSLNQPNQKDPCLIHLEPEEDPPPSSEGLTEGKKELELQVESKDEQNHLHIPTLAPPAPPLTIEAFCDQVRPRPRLCGYLQKQGGPLRAWKQRWFTYEEKKNQLFYYRTPQDVMSLGRVELSGATFTYPLKAEKGTFHIKTPERTFILKAVTQELMLYWLQQLQVRRWQHRQMSTCTEPTNNNNNTADDFLPLLKSPLGLVGEEAASAPTQRTPLSNMSIKHPLIEIQNSVHSLRKRSSQEWSQSTFPTNAPPWIPTSSADSTSTTGTSGSSGSVLVLPDLDSGLVSLDENLFRPKSPRLRGLVVLCFTVSLLHVTCRSSQAPGLPPRPCLPPH
ncbi:uncharacterized protein [Leuresthes tenuis]|uniref:uncharacterized protein n=1 Tax=Leuresthes tenuis TaxID=355514 RepID=UPI003B50A6D6